ncbi:MAG TPA: diguanylate cyclase, partial [Thermoanaerobaculia bacterium]|nr:diguanylate cyclase [Thermoanaerobaculia bacterium]
MAKQIRRLLGRAAEPQILFPMLALLALGALWGATASLIRIERANAERAALASTRELVETYHAQVVRAVREIDATLKVLQYAVMHRDHQGDLKHLGEMGLLPPDLLFVVSLVDREGNIASSTRPLPLTNVAHREYFREQRHVDGLMVSLPRQDPESGEWVLRFTRRLEDEQGDFAGVAMVSVAADFFVSGYEAAKLGEEGVLGLLGTDGVFRARRTGEAITYGEVVDYATSIDGTEAEEIEVALAVNPWDGVRRYTGAQQLYDSTLTVVVGLSEAEQMAVVARQTRIYLWRAAVASAALIVVLAALGRMAWQLAASRKQAYLTQREHAKQVEHLAYHDKLTGLPNRSLFSTLLHQAILGARRYDRQLAVLFLDLDRFKHINDTLG